MLFFTDTGDMFLEISKEIYIPPEIHLQIFEELRLVYIKYIKDPTFMTSTQKGTVGDLGICHVFADSIFLNNRSIVLFCGW